MRSCTGRFHAQAPHDRLPLPLSYVELGKNRRCGVPQRMKRQSFLGEAAVRQPPGFRGRLQPGADAARDRLTTIGDDVVAAGLLRRLSSFGVAQDLAELLADGNDQWSLCLADGLVLPDRDELNFRIEAGGPAQLQDVH